MTKIPIIGLIGGVGSGKSTLARWVSKRRNVVVIDGDQAGHRVLLEKHIKEKLQIQFGCEIIDPITGEIDRRYLGKLVWGDSSEQRKKRAALEAIVHPEIRRYFLDQINSANEIQQLKTKNDQVEAIILDAAILLETGWKQMCDAVVFIETSFEDRLQRVQSRRGWSKETLIEREKSQLPLSEKQRQADYIVNNSYSNNGLEQAGRALETVLDQILLDK